MSSRRGTAPRGWSKINMSTPSQAGSQAPPQAPRQSQGSSAGAKKGGRGKPRIITGFTQEDMVIKKPVTVEERVKYRRKREERSEIQQMVDKLVLEAYREWLAAGKPRKVIDMPLTVWTIRKAKEEDARFMLGKAAALIQRQLRYGDCPETGGKVELAFYVIDRAVKVVEPDSPENGSAGE